VTVPSAALFAPGFFSSSPVQIAAAIGAIVAVVSGAVGTFTVIRGQSFAGESLADVTTTGGSAAYLAGVASLWGFVAVALVAAGAMELSGVQRPRGRDLATGIVLGAGLGLAALFLYLDTVQSDTTGATFTILFGSIFTVASTTLAPVLAAGAVTLVLVAALFRPLLLCSVSAELASARGIHVRLVGMLHLVALAIAVALAALTIGTILSTALLVGPAATALRLTRSPGRAIAAAGLIGIVAVWLGILMAYDSYYWPPAGHTWPVSFFVVALILVFYVLAGAASRARSRGKRPAAAA
jgi:zinc/manganese transport system permease protein